MKKINTLILTNKIRQFGTALAFFSYPFLAGIAFAAHPNLTSLAINQDIREKITEFHGNSFMHFGHLLMGIAVLALIVIAMHMMKLLEDKKPLTGLIGGSMAVIGAVILAMDKAALCFVPSAFDSVSPADYVGLIPGIIAMFSFKGYLAVLHLLPLLPLGFIILSIGLIQSKAISRKYTIPVLAGSVLMCNPDIDIIGLTATIIMAIGFIPYAVSEWRKL